MQLKVADDKSPDITALEALLRRADVDARRRKDIEDEIWAIRLGARVEADAAYQLEFDLRDNRNWVTIHDLRLEIEGQVAQIDHLVVSRLLEVFVCESKSFSGGVKVNDHGEWTTFRDRRPVGIGSPVEQNRRHIAVLERGIKLGLIELPRRVVSIKPSFVNIVLVSERGTISRPRRKLPDMDSVVKVDQFRTRLLAREIPKLSMLKVVGTETIEALDGNSSPCTSLGRWIGRSDSGSPICRRRLRRPRSNVRVASAAPPARRRSPVRRRVSAGSTRRDSAGSCIACRASSGSHP